MQNRLESLLEEAYIKVSSLVSDLLGASARRMLQALADGETDPATLAGLASRRLLKLTLDELRQIEDHIAQLDHEMARLLSQHQDAVRGVAADHLSTISYGEERPRYHNSREDGAVTATSRRSFAAARSPPLS